MTAGRPNLQVGPRVARPARFRPDHQWTEGAFWYRWDSTLSVCRLDEIHWKGEGRSGFFRATRRQVPLSRPSPAPIASSLGSKPRHRRAQAVALRGFAGVAIMAMAMVVYPYFPAAQYTIEQSLPHPVQTSAAASTPVSPVNRLIIPKIGVSVDILEAPDLSILDRQEGVWHQTGSLVGGNMVLAGHRWKYLPPNSTTFYNLGKLQVGDTAVVDWNHQRYVYVVKSISVIPATKTDILLPTTLPTLTLYTCNDKRQTQRVSVVAEALP